MTWLFPGNLLYSETITAYSDYIYVLKDGHIVTSGIPETVVTKEMLADVFKVDTEIIISRNSKPYIIFNGSIQ